MAIKVAHVRGQRFVFAIEAVRRSPPERPPRFGGSINLDRRIDPQQIIQAANVVAVPVGEYEEVQLAEVHSQRFDVVFENLGIPARVEKDPLAAVLHQRAKSPRFRHGRRLPKRVVKHRDAIAALTFANARKWKNGKQNRRNQKTVPQPESHGASSQHHRTHTLLFALSELRPVLPGILRPLSVLYHAPSSNGSKPYQNLGPCPERARECESAVRVERHRGAM